MKASTKAAAGAGIAAATVGLAAAFLCPIAGLVAGGCLAYGAATGAGFGLLASVALGAAGAVGGLTLGRIAAPIVAFASVALGTALGGAVKLVGALFDRKDPAPKAPAPNPLPAPAAAASAPRAGLKASFSAGLRKSAPQSNGAAPQAKPLLLRL